MNTPSAETGSVGRLGQNIMHFGRVLRAAGVPVGPDTIVDAVRAVETAGVQNRVDFYWTLHSVFTFRHDQHELFDQAFGLFWRDPELLRKVAAILPPGMRRIAGSNTAEVRRRVDDALYSLRRRAIDRRAGATSPADARIDAAMTFSNKELLQTIDFESMTSEELATAKRVIASLRLPVMSVPTRRFRPDPGGARIDIRATLRAELRSGGGMTALRWRSPRRRHPPLVAICDISGSMNRYSRMLLHFLHAITNDQDRVYSFLFGTQLTHITHYLRNKDVDAALDRVGQSVSDWSGGTRIGDCLEIFNRKWSRQVLTQSAVVLFITDGLDLAPNERLATEMERLQKSCRRLIWLNPLLRYEGFEPRTRGAKAILPHVDEFRPVHDLESLADLVAALRRPIAPNTTDGAKFERLTARPLQGIAAT